MNNNSIYQVIWLSRYNIFTIITINILKVIILELLVPYASTYFGISVLNKQFGVYDFGMGFWLLVIILSNCAGSLLNILSKYLYKKTYPVLSNRLRQMLFVQSLKISMDFLIHKGEGILEAINESISTGTTDTTEYIIDNIIPGAILIISFLIYIFIQDVILGLLYIALLTIYIGLFLYLFSKTFKLSKQYNNIQNQRTSTLIDIFKRIKIIRVFRIQNNLFLYISKFLKQEFQQYNLYLQSDIINTSIVSFIYFILEIGIYYYLYHSFIIGKLKPEKLLNVFGFGLSMTDNINNIMKDVLEIYESVGQMQHSLQQLSSRSYHVNNNHIALTQNIYSIIINNVSVKRNHQYVLRNLNLELRIDDTLVIVGESGIGKSTLLNILLGLTKVDTGSVLINNVDIKQYYLSSVHNQIVYIGQSSEFFNTSIVENLRLFNPKLKINTINKALNSFQLSNLSNKIDESIGSGGGKLSGGQATRLSILRAILSSPKQDIKNKLFMADEPTTGLDMKNQKNIVRYITSMNTNIKIITDHSGLLPKYSTKVLYLLQNGQYRIASHDYLFKTVPSYREFFDTDTKI